MRGLRTVPALVKVAEAMQRRCPAAVLLNYANPMAINVWGLAEFCDVEVYGLCHSVPLTAAHLASDLGVAVEELGYVVAGINHMAFFLRLEHHGRDLYPELKRLYPDPADAPRRGEWGLPDAVRYEMLRRVGYFVTESSEHAQFAARHDLIGTVLVGARSPAEAAENWSHLHLEVPDELWTALEEVAAASERLADRIGDVD